MSVVTLTADDTSISFDGSKEAKRYILRSIDGWLETPDSKMDLDERASGDGAHDVPASQNLYAARTVVIGYRLLADSAHDRDGLLAMQERIRSLVHHEVTIRVQDASRDLTCTGYVQSIEVTETVQNVNWQTLTGQVTLVCPRPELLSQRPHRYQLTKRGALQSGDGLCYGTGLGTYWVGEPNNSESVLVSDTLAGTCGIQYPVRYTYHTEVAYSNKAIMVNDGSSRAYPVFKCYGPWPKGVSLDFPALDLRLACSMPVEGEPLILDCRTRTATLGKTDCSYALTKREFPVIDARSSLAVVLSAEADGYVDVIVHDTYM